MKKKLVAVPLVMALTAIMISGCAKSNKIDNDTLEVGGYKGIEVTEVKVEEVTDDMVDNKIDSVLEEHKTSEEVTDRAVEDGDTITLDYTGKKDGVAFDGGTAEDATLVIGSGQFIEGFEDSAIGHNIGDTYDWNGKFPDDYQSEDLAGQEVVFTITIKGITKDILPELNDDFVKEVSDSSKTVAEYKKEIKKELEEEAKETQKNTLMGSVWSAVLDKAEVKKYDDKEVKTKTDEAIEQYKQMAESYGMKYEDLAAQYGLDSTEELEKQIEDNVKSTMKQTMVTEAIMKAEKLEPGDKEYEKYYQKLADANGFEDVDALKGQYDEEVIKEAADYYIVAEWLVDNCVQVKES